MEILYEILPKDLANIVDEYAKDRTNYNLVVNELNTAFEFFRDMYPSLLEDLKTDDGQFYKWFLMYMLPL